MKTRYSLAMAIFVLLVSKLTAQHQLRVHTYPLYGNASELQYYYANVYIGSPPQRQSVIIDTGSSFVGVPCNESCDANCGAQHNDPLYESASSNSFSNEGCNGVNISPCECSPEGCRYKQVVWCVIC
eukprot:TRINITY_DN4487_c0_g3_i5.p1 TRINITY_DN4487_c0_g3~~TRINITY_DN4487_c0_g3_i5.p1  ORF type:complete len:127 (-),score=7.54 TRINITY_DN4487_c0_g3_i5:401-781(-)